MARKTSFISQELTDGLGRWIMYNKDYYLAHREEILARAKKWREEHPEKYKKALKRCVKRNGLKYKIQQKLYRCMNWLKISDKQREYIKNNREKLENYRKKYREENIRRLRSYDKKYKTKKRYANINNWAVYYEIQNTRFYWTAIKDKFKITDEKENGFPSLHSAYKNAKRVLGE